MKNNIPIFILLLASFYFTPSSAQTQLGTDILGASNDSRFGHSVSMSSDGNRLASTAVFGGYAQVYEWTNNNWTQLGSTLDGNLGQTFGLNEVTLSANGNRLALGFVGWFNMSTGLVQVYEWQNNSWVQLGSNLTGPIEYAQFGHSIKLSADGSRMVVGAWGSTSASDSSRVYVFDWSEIDTSWQQVGYFNDSRGFLGNRVDISDDGNRIGLSQNNGGKVYEWQNNNWVQLGAKLPDPDGTSYIAISADGKRVLSANTFIPPSNSEVKVYEWDNNNWVQVGDPIAFHASSNRRSIVLSDDGNRIAMGGSTYSGNTPGSNQGDGQVRMYEWSNGSWVLLGSAINGSSGQGFGHSVAISSNGNRLVAGTQEITNVGRVKVYDYSMVTSTQTISGIPVEVYPNPTSGLVQITGVTPDIVRVTDARGHLVKVLSNPRQEINLADLPAGVYFLEVREKGQWATQKIIKE